MDRTGREAAEGESPQGLEGWQDFAQDPRAAWSGNLASPPTRPRVAPSGLEQAPPHPTTTSRLSGPRLPPISSAPGLSHPQLRPGFSRVPSEVDG